MFCSSLMMVITIEFCLCFATWSTHMSLNRAQHLHTLSKHVKHRQELSFISYIILSDLHVYNKVHELIIHNNIGNCD